MLKTNSFIASLVSVVTFIIFLPSLQNEFVNWDDDYYVYENFFIRSLDKQLLKEAVAEFHAANWHPLTWLSHAFDYAIWGLNPLGHHLTNNILHALNTLIVVLLVIRLMEVYTKTAGNNGPSKPILNSRTIRITGVAAGLLFGLHPVHVESVAWVAERKDLLCAFFFLLSTMTYTNYVCGINANASMNSASRFLNEKYFFTIGFFILALLSKPMAVTLPVVLLILDWYPFRRIMSLKAFWTVSIEKLPFFALAIISSILTIFAQKSVGAIQSIEAIPLASRLIVAAKSLIAYLVKMLLPLDLAPFYPYPANVSLFSMEYIISIVMVIAITVTCLAVMRKQKLWMSVWSYYVITLIPVLGIVQVGSQAMADRYTYLPSLGVFLLIGFMAARVYERVSALTRWRVTARLAVFLLAMAVLASISYATTEQISIWKNNIALWSYAIEKEPGVPIAHNNLGIAYRPRGQLDTAIEEFETALRLKPDYVEAHNNLGEAYISKGQLDMAIEQYQTALRLKPDYAMAHNNLGVAYISKGQLDMAIEQYQTALRLKPDCAEAHFNLGLIYLNSGFKDMAKTEFELGLRYKPDDYKAQQVLNSIISSNY